MNFLVKMVSMVQNKRFTGKIGIEFYIRGGPIFKFPQIQVLESTDVLFTRDAKICLGY